MNTTDELRRLLDERCIHWWAGADEHKTLWESNGLTWEYFNNENGDAWLGFLSACEQDITPEQAIAATLGGGECERVKHGTKPDGTPRYRCSVCGYGLGDYRWAYCPKCGRKIRKAGKR